MLRPETGVGNSTTTTVRRLLLAFVAYAAAVGCGVTRSRVTTGRETVASLYSDTLVTAAELSRMPSDETLMQALRHVRPRFLGSSRGMPMVVVEGAPPAEMAVLETIRVAQVAEVKLVRGSPAAERVVATPDGRVVLVDVVVVRLRPGR
jgi:hypothetical protein